MEYSETGAKLSLPDQRWRIYPSRRAEAQGLSQATGLSPLLGQVLLNRGIETPAAAQAFLQPETLLLPSPLDEFPDLAVSVALLLEAIETGQKIAICGDYDADGMTSTALLLRALRFLGADVTYAIPSRMQEGYGINSRIVADFYAEGIGIILTVDNGIAAVEPIAYARELGLAVIVTDHHDVPPEIPPANAILNPKLIDPASPYRGVAGVGVAYILAICLAQTLGRTQDLTAPLLELFTLGTIADLAPLTGVNRRWVKRGLGLLPKSRIIGVQALIQVAGLSDQGKTLKPEDIGFRLGPRINAVGRISDPQIVIEMLTTDDVGLALERAMQCEQANQSRREMCDRIEEEAVAYCEAQQADGALNLKRDRILLVIQPGWHHGVIGIVASRLVERYGVPVFIGTYEDDDQKEIRGSARSIPEFNVFDGLQACHDLLTKFGGHRAAGGFSFPSKHLRQVKSRLVNYANQVLALEHLKPLVTVDGQAHLAEVTLDLYEQADTLHPCGMDNPDPVFWTPNVRVLEQKAMGKTRAHLKLTVAQEGGAPLEAIAWRWGHHCPLPSPLDIAYKLKLNEWQGNRTLQLELVGVRPVSAPPDPSESLNSSDSLNLSNSPNTSDPWDPTTGPSRAAAAPVPPAVTLKLPQIQPPPPKSAPPSPATVPGGSTVAEAARPVYPEGRSEADRPNLEPISTEGQASPPLDVPPLPLAEVEFFYSRRPYRARIARQGEVRELHIDNPEGQTLVVMLPERQGYLHLPGQPPRPVDVGEAYYFNLIHAGMGALERRHQARLLVEKDELLAEKDGHIATLTQQVTLLEQKLSQLSAEQQQEFHSLRQASQTQATAIQSQEAHIATLQEHLPPDAAAIDPKALKQSVRSRVGDSLWFCLQPQSQTDLYSAYKQVQLIARESRDPAQADYSAAGKILGTVVEREVLHPFCHDLSDFLLAQGDSPQLGDLSLAPGKAPHLGQLVSLLADRWQALSAPALKAIAPPGDDTLYRSGKSRSSRSDVECNIITAFLSQWEHPMGQGFLQDATTAASLLDQIHTCHRVALGKQPLYRWSFDLMEDALLGDRGLLRHIYGS